MYTEIKQVFFEKSQKVCITFLKESACPISFLKSFCFQFKVRNVKSNRLQIIVYTTDTTSKRDCLDSFFYFYCVILTLKHMSKDQIEKMIQNHHCDFIYLAFMFTWKKKVENTFNPIGYQNCDFLNSSISYKIFIVKNYQIGLHNLPLIIKESPFLH